MAERPSLAPRLRELDDAIEGRGMPLSARARVAERLRKEAQRREALQGFRFRWLPALTFAAGAALVLLVVGLGLQREPTPATAQAPLTVLGGFTVEGEGCRHREAAGDLELIGACRLVSPQMTVHTWAEVVLREDEGVRLVRGTALFDVTTVDRGEPPVRVHVSHGSIEVLGTRFTIEQGRTGGHVDLFEGRIRFVSPIAAAVAIEPGQRHAWGEAVAAIVDERAEADRGASAVAVVASDPLVLGDDDDDATAHRSRDHEATASARAPTRRARTPAGRVEAEGAPSEADAVEAESAAELPLAGEDEAARIIEAVARLRAEGRFAEAVKVLRRAESARRWDRRTAQVLSYEQGQILQRHLDDHQAACAHWARHQQRFPQGRYDRAVATAQQALGCDP